MVEFLKEAAHVVPRLNDSLIGLRWNAMRLCITV